MRAKAHALQHGGGESAARQVGVVLSRRRSRSLINRVVWNARIRLVVVVVVVIALALLI